MSDDCAHWFPDVGAAGAAVLAAIVIAGVRQRVPRFRAVVSASHDRDDVAELARHTYGGHDYICEQLPEWCASPACAPHGIEVAGQLVALENARLLDDGRTLWLEALRVHPTMRRRGLASRLQHGTLHAARQRWPGLQRVRYTTQLTNGASIALARSCGMREAYRWGFVFVPALSVPAFMARAKELRAELAAQTAGKGAGCGHDVLETNAAGLLTVLQQHGDAPLMLDWKVHEATLANVSKLMRSGASAAVREDGSYHLARIRPDAGGAMVTLTVAMPATLAASPKVQLRCLVAHVCAALEGLGGLSSDGDSSAAHGKSKLTSSVTGACAETSVMMHYPVALWSSLRTAGMAPRTNIGAVGDKGEAGCAAESTCVLLERTFKL